MAYRYDDRERRWRSEEEEESRDFERGHGYDRRSRLGRGYSREGDYYGERNRGFRHEGDYGRGPGRESDFGRDYGRNYGHGREYGPDYHWEDEMGRNYGRQEPYGRGSRMYGPDDHGRRSARQEDFEQQGEFYDEWDEEFDEPVYWTYTEYWLVPGPYTGVGPQGYQRSTERIKEDVCERLTQHGRLDASNIQVDVEEGEVILKGSVDSRRSKRIAEDIAESVPGVWDVNNQLRIREGRRDQGKLSSGGRSKHGQFRPGMEVIGMDGEKIGEVKEVHSDSFLVDRPLARDVYVPFDACRSTSGNRIVLHIPSIEVDDQDWQKPDLIETPEMSDRER